MPEIDGFELLRIKEKSMAPDTVKIRWVAINLSFPKFRTLEKIFIKNSLLPMGMLFI